MYLNSNSQSKDLGIEFRCRLSFNWSWGALAQEANRSLESHFQGTACLSQKNTVEKQLESMLTESQMKA